MPGVKKDSSTRARANRASTAAVLSAPTGRRKMPVLPPMDEDPWHPAVEAWWADLWSSPMSTEYHESDLHQLYLLARLYQAFYEAPTPTLLKDLAGEIRLQRQAFGLTPYDRRRLEWSIESAESAKERGQQRRRTSSAVPPVSADDPRAALRVV